MVTETGGTGGVGSALVTGEGASEVEAEGLCGPVALGERHGG